MDKQTIFTEVKMALIELFEVDGDAVTLDAHLYQDLELDSVARREL